MVEWRPCAGYPDYEISEHGAVRRISSHARWGCREKTPWLRNGYIFVKMPGNKSEKVHRLVAFSFIGAPPSPKHEVAHGDGTRTNNHFTNLRWATRSENMKDAVAHGTRRGPHKLQRHQVEALRARAAAGVSQRRLASEFGISQPHVSGILSGKFWIALNGAEAA